MKRQRHLAGPHADLEHASATSELVGVYPYPLPVSPSGVYPRVASEHSAARSNATDSSIRPGA